MYIYISFLEYVIVYYNILEMARRPVDDSKKSSRASGRGQEQSGYMVSGFRLRVVGFECFGLRIALFSGLGFGVGVQGCVFLGLMFTLWFSLVLDLRIPVGLVLERRDSCVVVERG